MKGWKKVLSKPSVTAGAFVMAAGLLLFSGVGGARAALNYYSETYSGRVQLQDIGVTLTENGENVSWRNYTEDGSWDQNTGTLLTNLLAEGESVNPGQKYNEVLAVKNTGTINQYVRVSVYKYWLDADGNKTQNVSPDLINLHLTENGWIADENSSTPERTVLYYSKLLNSGETSTPFADTLTIDPQVATKVTQTTETENGYTTITTTYDYDGLQFCVEASVDAVQEHNAEDAILSAWGRKVSISNGSLSLN